MTAVTASTFLQKLARPGDRADPPTFEQIAELVCRLAKRFMTESRQFGSHGIFSAAFFGLCPHEQQYKVAYIDGRDDAGSFRVELPSRLNPVSLRRAESLMDWIWTSKSDQSINTLWQPRALHNDRQEWSAHGPRAQLDTAPAPAASAPSMRTKIYSLSLNPRCSPYRCNASASVKVQLRGPSKRGNDLADAAAWDYRGDGPNSLIKVDSTDIDFTDRPPDKLLIGRIDPAIAVV
jgi:hypothetical protein